MTPVCEISSRNDSSLQVMLKSELTKLKRKSEANGTDEPDAKKIKVESKPDPEKETMKKQNKKMFYYRDLLKKNCKKKEMESLLEHNHQEVTLTLLTFL